MLNIRKTYIALLIGATLGLGACASKIQKAEIASSANPTDEVANLEKSLQEAQSNNVDVLANNDFKTAKKYWEAAKEDLRDQEDQEDILENVAYGKAYLSRATTLAEGRQSGAGQILTARTAAIDAGANKFKDQKEKLAELDEEIIDASEDIKMNLTADEISKLQQDYMALETSAIQETRLGNARAGITGAINDGAEKRAPKTLKTAQVDISSAENLIAQNSGNPMAYAAGVAKANASAQFLVEVTKAANSNGKNTSEAVAVQLVQQQRKIGNLQTNLGTAESNIDQLGRTVNSQGQALAGAQASVGMQKAIESARQEFTNDEAEVYQQGDKLVIRLKSMNFSSGRSELPQESLDILSKVNQVVGSLPVSGITVEGHTDSTGSASINQKISQDRAEAVAKYLETNAGATTSEITAVGHGFKKPIASNKSKEGRAQNRRVDVIVSTDQ